MNMNPLNDYPAVRKALYMVQWLVNGVVVLAGAYYVLAEVDPQKWYLLVAGLAPVLWTYLGITAQTNTNTTPDLAEHLVGYEAEDPEEYPETVSGNQDVANPDRLTVGDIPMRRNPQQE